MAVTGAEIIGAARLLSPLINDLYVGAKDSIKSGLRKWASGQYSEKIAERIASVENVKTLWQFEKEVAVRDFYFPISVIDEKQQSRVVYNLAELKTNRCVIEGIVGQGKSIFMRFLCVQELSQGQGRRIPVFIEMRTITTRLGIVDRALEELRNYGVDADDNIFDYLSESGKLSLLLDGYDELEPDPQGNVLRELTSLSRRFPDLQIIVSSRPDHDPQKITGFSVLRIAPLEPNLHVSFLQKLGLGKMRASEIARAISDSPTEIASLITTPLMLTLTILVYTFESQIPPELDEFYEALFTTVISRHDKSKPGFSRELKTRLGERALRKLFESFCFMAAQKELTRTLTGEQFATAFERAIGYCDDVKCSVEDFRSDICNVACLMQEEGFGHVTYLHKSIAEYFAASFVRRQQQNGAERFYGSARQNDSIWKGVLYFLSKIDRFRYNQLFLMPEIDHAFHMIGVDAGCPTEGSMDDAVLKTLVKKVLLSPQAQFDHRSFIRAVTEDRSAGNFIIEKIASDAMRGISSGIPWDSSVVDTYLSPDLPDDETSADQISYPLPVEYVTLRQFMRALEQSINETIAIYSEAKMFNSREEAKQDIF
jgi:hypothetical protein